MSSIGQEFYKRHEAICYNHQSSNEGQRKKAAPENSEAARFTLLQAIARVKIRLSYTEAAGVVDAVGSGSIEFPLPP